MNLSCKSCGAETKPEDKFCRGCGGAIVREPVKQFCTGCGALVASGTNFCANCGTRAGDAPRSAHAQSSAAPEEEFIPISPKFPLDSVSPGEDILLQDHASEMDGKLGRSFNALDVGIGVLTLTTQRLVWKLQTITVIGALVKKTSTWEKDVSIYLKDITAIVRKDYNIDEDNPIGVPGFQITTSNGSFYDFWYGEEENMPSPEACGQIADRFVGYVQRLANL